MLIILRELLLVTKQEQFIVEPNIVLKLFRLSYCPSDPRTDKSSITYT